MRIDEFAPAEFNEHFETNPGLDEVYTSTHVAAGNGADPDYNTALVGGGPAHWGAQCGRIDVGATNGAAGWRQHLAAQSNSGFMAHFAFILLANAMAAGTGVTIMVAKVQGDPDLADLVWSVSVVYSGGETYLFFQIFGAGGVELFTTRYPSAGTSITIGVTYDNRVKHDIANGTYSWTVNDVAVSSGALPAGFLTNIATKYIGSSGGSSGRNVAYVLDRIIWQDLALGTFSAPELMRFASFGFDVAIPYDTVSLDGYIARTKAYDGSITRTKAFEVEG